MSTHALLWIIVILQIATLLLLVFPYARRQP